MISKIKQLFCNHSQKKWDLIGEEGIFDKYNVYCQDCNKLIYKDIWQINYQRELLKYKEMGFSNQQLMSAGASGSILKDLFPSLGSLH